MLSLLHPSWPLPLPVGLQRPWPPPQSRDPDLEPRKSPPHPALSSSGPHPQTDKWSQLSLAWPFSSARKTTNNIRVVGAMEEEGIGAGVPQMGNSRGFVELGCEA